MVGKPALLGAKLLAGFLPKNNNFEERELEPWYGERAYMRLTVARIQIASPGVLEFIGNLLTVTDFGGLDVGIPQAMRRSIDFAANSHGIGAG